jgi:two-component system OmpR family response regulator
MNGDAPRILVVDDDIGILDALGEYLERSGFAFTGARSGAEMDAVLARGPVDVVVLDVMMPGEDGLSICRRLVGSRTPILMLSAMGETTDRIVGLEVGADDYLAKPFDPRELLARVRALLRRGGGQGEAARGGRAMFQGWSCDLLGRELTDPDGARIQLTGGEFALLRAFIEHPRRVLTRDQLLEFARGPMAETYDRAIDLQVSRLRRKLDREDLEELIETVRGEGYRFLPQVRWG